MSITRKLKLFAAETCPFCAKAEIVAKEKKLPYEKEFVDVHGKIPEWYTKLNPNETVPTLLVNDKKVILESDLISQYIDAIAPSSGLMMSADNAIGRQRIEFFMSQAGDLGRAARSLLQDPFNVEKRKNLDDNAKYVDGLFAATQLSGPFLLDDRFSYGDICILPFLHQFKITLAYYAGYDLFSQVPHLKKMYAAAIKRESVASTFRPAEEYVTSAIYLIPEGSPFKEANGRHVLFTSNICPFADRARLAASITGLPYHAVEMHPRSPPVWYKYFNYRETVPALMCPSGEAVHESANIVQYIDAVQRSKNSKCCLFPRDDPEKQYAVQYFSSLIGTLFSGFWQYVFQKSESGLADCKWSGAELEKIMKEKHFGDGPFLGGKEMNGGDVLILPVLVRIHSAYPVMFNYDFFGEFKLLNALYKAGIALPAGKEIFLPDEKYLELLQGYTKASH